MEAVTTARLLGRRPQESDADDYVRIWTDTRIAEAAWPARLRTADDARRVLNESIRHWERWGYGPWTVVERDGGAIVGRVGLRHAVIAGTPEVELAWFIDADRWGRGYATEMAREAVRLAFEAHGFDELAATTTPANAASQAVMAKLGFAYERDVEQAGLAHLLSRLRRLPRPSSSR